MAILGIDIGGSGIKGAPVDVTNGTLVEERFRVETPQPSDVTSVVEARVNASSGSVLCRLEGHHLRNFRTFVRETRCLCALRDLKRL